MTHHWDEFTKSLAQPVPRRESLRRLGVVFAGTILSPLGAGFAWGGKATSDPCKAFCKCRNKRQQDQCLSACRACGNNPSRLGGSCGNYFCCGVGLTSCGSYCADLAHDPDNCGACGAVCGDDEYCEGGVCQSQETCIPYCAPGWCGDDGCGGVCGCPDGMYCPAYSNWCAISEPTPF